MSAYSQPVAPGTARFEHVALFYSGDEEYLEGTVPFLLAGVQAGEPALVAVDERRTGLLQEALGEHADAVEFADMHSIGRNPARIIPVWESFVSEHCGEGKPVRGIGEPIWPERAADELVECHHHESLLNLAFDDGPAWSLMCPYDAQRLDVETLATARRTHPVLIGRGRRSVSRSYVAPDSAHGPFTGQLHPAPDDHLELAFSAHDLSCVRAFVAARAGEAGLDPARSFDLVLAVSELAANSVAHGGGAGTIHAWVEAGGAVVEVRDRGRFEEPLTGRRVQAPTSPQGRGLYLVNQLCDLVQIRSLPSGTVVRVRLSR